MINDIENKSIFIKNIKIILLLFKMKILTAIQDVIFL